jgi:hypothetical protein
MPRRVLTHISCHFFNISEAGCRNAGQLRYATLLKTLAAARKRQYITVISTAATPRIEMKDIDNKYLWQQE